MKRSGLPVMRGVVIHWYQSEARSSHCAAGVVGQPMSTWKPAMAVPKTKSLGNVPMTGTSPGLSGADGAVDEEDEGPGPAAAGPPGASAPAGSLPASLP